MWEEGSGWAVGCGGPISQIQDSRFVTKVLTRVVRTCPNQGKASDRLQIEIMLVFGKFVFPLAIGIYECVSLSLSASLSLNGKHVVSDVAGTATVVN